MKKLRSIILSFALVLGFASPLLVPAAAYADDTATGGGTGGSSACTGSATECLSQGVNNAGGGSNSIKLEDGIKTIVNVLLFVLGAIAVIMIIIGGIRYATSNGDASATKSAKDTVLYAVIGLIVAILAYAIVNFTLSAFKSGS